MKQQIDVKIFFKLLLLFLCACQSTSKQPPSATVNENIANRIFTQKKPVVILSCIRCECFIDAVNSLYKNNSSVFQEFTFFTDTNCNKLNFKATYIAQKTLDSLSNDIFNLALIKSQGNSFEVKIVDTEQASQLLSVINQFLKN